MSASGEMGEEVRRKESPFALESAKVVELLQRPFGQLPMSSDLPRLTNIRVVDENGRSEYEQPPMSAPTVEKLRYTFVSLTALLMDEEAVEATKKVIDEHFESGGDVSKMSMERLLEKIGGEESPVVQVLKSVNQSAISPAIIHLKLKLGLSNMTKDVRDSWFYEIIVSSTTGQVVVASHKRDQSIKNDYQYEWVMAVHFDRIERKDNPSLSSNPSNTDDSDIEEGQKRSSKASTSDHQSDSPHSNASSDLPPSPSSLPSSNLPPHELVLKRKQQFIYKCTDASLAVTDLMFSLQLHTSQQQKRTEISKILEPYSTPDVLDLSFTRNWEFFTASAMAELISKGAIDIKSSFDSGSGQNTRLSSSPSQPSSSIPSGNVSSTSSDSGLTSSGQVGQVGGSQYSSQLDSSLSSNHQHHHHGHNHNQSASTSSPSSQSSSNPSIQSSSSSTTLAPAVHGVKEYDNGDRYEGDLRLGIRDGNGKYTCKSTGVVYDGGYKEGKRHGNGKYEFVTGAKVEGEFQRGVLVTGRYVFPNGDVYVGDFKDDKFEGQGEWKGVAGDTYVGAWKAGKRHGVGSARLSHGDSYQGEFQNDLFHGFGKYFFSNGDLFNGQFTHGLINGVGEYTFASSNKILLGEFSNGKLVKSSSITNPSSTPASSITPSNHLRSSSGSTSGSDQQSHQQVHSSTSPDHLGPEPSPSSSHHHESSSAPNGTSS